jgi:hypothetical protein
LVALMFDRLVSDIYTAMVEAFAVMIFVMAAFSIRRILAKSHCGPFDRGSTRIEDLYLARKGFSRTNWLLLGLNAIMAAVLIIVTVARIRLLDVPLERDEGEFAYMGQLLLQGIPPYSNAYTMKFPGVSAAYAVFMTLFGQTPFGIHLGLLIVNLISAGMVWLLARRLLGTQIAAAATAIYALMSVSQGVLGIFAHATHFVILFALAGFLLLMRHLDDRRMWPLAVGGVSFGFALIMKQHAVVLWIFAFLYLLWVALRRGDSVRLLVGKCSVFLFGAAAPIAVLFAWMFKVGIFERFWFWTVSYPTHYVSEVPVITGLFILSYQAHNVVSYQPLIWLVALFGYLFVRQRIERDNLIFVCGFFASAFFAMCPGFYFRPHYFVLILVPVALFAGHFVVETRRVINSNNFVPPLISFMPLALLALLCCVGLYSERHYLFVLPANEVSRSVYEKEPFSESIVIANYIREHSAENDKIAVLGSEPQIYFYAHRLSATAHIYMHNLTMTSGSIAERFIHEMISDIESQRPLYIVKVAYQWAGNPGLRQKLDDWSGGYLNNYYKRVGYIDIYQDKSNYYWDSDASNVKPYSNSFVTIWRREAMPLHGQSVP